MAGQFAGRNLVIRIGATAVAGFTTKSINGSATPINVTTETDSGVVSYLASVMTEDSLEITGSGYTEDDVLKDIWFGPQSGRHIANMSFMDEAGNSYTGNFIMTSFSLTGAQDEGEGFEATFVRNGAGTWTANT